jgi:translocon-associated protein subunit beta
MASSSSSSAVVRVLLLACLISVATAADTAFLVVHKKAAIAKVKASEKITVSISLYNAGASPAYDVSLNDDTWPEDIFTVITGNTSQSWEKLDAGESLSHVFVLEPKVKGPFYGPPAVVKYRMAAKSALQEAHSTPLPELDLFSDKPAENKLEWIKAFGFKYGPLMIVVSFVGLFTYLLVSPSKSKKLSKASKKRR